MTFWKRLLGDTNATAIRAAEPIVAKVGALEDAFRALSDTELKEKTAEFKKRLAEGLASGAAEAAVLDSLAPEAFAAVREASRRTLGQRHFDVQLIGGMILHQGNISEMRTGEGKTLVATLPAYLNALTGKGVHIVTVNDYLSRRDAVWMGEVYDALGLSVGIINHEASFLYDASRIPAEEAAQDDPSRPPRLGEAGLSAAEADATRDATGAFKVVHDFLQPCSRREAYAADITYGTNNEFGFDYLRDNLEYEKQNLRQRLPTTGSSQATALGFSKTARRQENLGGGYHFAIVDEIDSILIDEARTPLIISAPVSDAEALYGKFAAIAQTMVPEEDYIVEEKHKQISLTDSGIEKAERALGVDNIYTDAGIKLVHHLETAVRAKALFHRDKEYVIRDGQVVIVDEFTGRLQPGRRWSEGLHQAIEAKEGVSIQQESRTFASITFQNYFRLYEKLAGMTGTAMTSSEEFYKVYGLNTVVVPTNKAVTRRDLDDLIFQTENGKYRAIAKRVKELHEKGQPVLVGTASVEKNEMLAAHFKQEGIPHEVLNAKNHEREGEIIAQAGRKGGVTIATNMAGRGVDIKLGGNPGTPEEYEGVKQLGGLFVLGTERHEARRIDNQLRGRSGRQGDPGETQFYVSLEDSLMRVFASDVIKRVMGTFKIPEDEPIYNSMITKSLERAQTRIEEINFDARKHVLAYDDILNAQRQSVYARRRSILTGEDTAIDDELAQLSLGDPSALVGAGENLTQAIEKKKHEMKENFYPMIRRVLLQSVDYLWVEHLEAMEYLRSSVNLRAYGQRDPLVEYKKEGLKLFQTMEETYRAQVSAALPNLGAPMPAGRGSDQSVGVIHKAAAQLTATGKAPARKEYSRNDRVTITDGKETKELKYKRAQPLLQSGAWKIVDNT